MHGKTFSASQSLSQWKLSLDSTLQEVSSSDSKVALPIDVGNTVKSLDAITLNQNEYVSDLLEQAIKCCLFYSDDFIKLWEISFSHCNMQDSTTINDENTTDLLIQPQQEITILALYKTIFQIATFKVNFDDGKYFNIPLNNIIKLVTFNECGSLCNTVNIIFNDGFDHEVTLNIKIISNNIDHEEMIINFCEYTTLYINSIGNKGFVVDYKTEKDEDILENFFNQNKSVDNDVVDFYTNFYTKIRDKNNFTFPLKSSDTNIESNTADSNTPNSTISIATLNNTTTNFDDSINNALNNIHIPCARSSSTTFGSNSELLSNSFFNESEGNRRISVDYSAQTSDNFLDFHSNTCNHIDEEDDEGAEDKLLHHRTTTDDDNDNNEKKLPGIRFSTGSFNIDNVKNKFGNVSNSVKNQFSYVSQKSASQINKISSWFKSKPTTKKFPNNMSTDSINKSKISVLTSNNSTAKVYII